MTKKKLNPTTEIKVAELKITRIKHNKEYQPYPLTLCAIDNYDIKGSLNLIYLEYKILNNHFNKFDSKSNTEFRKKTNSSKHKEFLNKYLDSLPTIVFEKTRDSFIFILNNLSEDNWKIEIIDFLDYVVDSFGKVSDPILAPIGLNEYLLFLKEELFSNRSHNLAKGFEKRIAFISNHISKTYVKDEEERRLFESLLTVYDDWYILFPFEIKLFGDVKILYSEKLPILKERKRINPYLGTPVLKFLSINEMLVVLLQITKKTTGSVSSKSLINNRIEYVRNDAKLKLDIINKKHLLEQSTLIEKYKAGNVAYLKTIKKWLSNERKYLNRVLKDYDLNYSYKSFKIEVDSNAWDCSRIKDFRDSLIKNNFISKIHLSSFKRVFSGNEIINKIVWLKSPTDLAYLINQMQNIIIVNKNKSTSPLITPTIQKHWDITVRCFIREDKIHFSPSNFSKLDLPADTTLLDKAISHLKP